MLTVSRNCGVLTKIPDDFNLIPAEITQTQFQVLYTCDDGNHKLPQWGFFPFGERFQHEWISLVKQQHHYISR